MTTPPQPSLPPLQTLNPLTLPLKGMQVIEASAGTGKTWTLAALYLRLVLGHTPGSTEVNQGLYPPQILVMTFTEAATSELRKRIRTRLSQAARFFREGDKPGDDCDDFLRCLHADIATDDWPVCADRLEMAAQWMDDAAIFTIHGWSSRMLKTHAFDSANLFEQSRVQDSDQLRLVAAQDYWRKWFYPLSMDQIDAMQFLGTTPDELLSQLGALWAQADKTPQAITAPSQTPDVLIENWEQWQSQFQTLESAARSACTTALIDLLHQTIAARRLRSYLTIWPGKLATWAQGESIAQMKSKDKGSAITLLERFSLTTLLQKNWDDASKYPAFEHFDRFVQHARQEPQVREQLLAHAAYEIGAAYQQAKERLSQFDFSDLLQNLYRACQAPDGRLASAIRQQYPVALVDEFQDTDPWQYGTLSRIYGKSDSTLDTGLIVIGDPKQAIYSFRGADLNTYLTARSQADAIHTLTGNYRSAEGVVAAINHVFERADKPFGQIPFEGVHACNPAVLPLQIQGQAHPAMTVWHLTPCDSVAKDKVTTALAQVFATQMVDLLQRGAAAPGNMAVLVRSWNEARAIRKALSERGVRSVYLSDRDSVFATQQALDLWRILRAIANPRDTRLIRAALCTKVWGQSWDELETLFHHESAWDDLTERFHHWQGLWQRQGFLPMLHHLLHDQHIPLRMQNSQNGNDNGERSLTNLLHLGDVLQTASVELQGENALIRYLEDQLRHPEASGDMAQLRLESDAHLVQVITLHKSKGLQYPLVFLPFISNYRAEKDDADKDKDRLAEDMRLLYVGLTRAERAIWVGVAQVKGDMDGKTPKVRSALSWLLGRTSTDDLSQRLQGWACNDIMVQTAPMPTDARYIPDEPAKVFKPAKEPQRHVTRHWWIASFSALTSHLARPALLESEQDDRWSDAQIDAHISADAIEPVLAAEVSPCKFNAFAAGSAYGTLLHDLLQWQAQNGWPAAHSPSGTAAWHKLIARKVQRFNLEDEAQTLLTEWIAAIVSTPLPLPLPLPESENNALILGANNARQYWAEMAFILQVQSLYAWQIDRLMHRYIHPDAPRPALHPCQLEGMLTGFIDLVIEHAGRYYVLDYKSNKLSDYNKVQMQKAILAHRYDVQMTLYVLALHRLLKARLPGYDYDVHVGGALYLFLRGIDQPGAGLYACHPPKALIEAMDIAFSKTPATEIA